MRCPAPLSNAAELLDVDVDQLTGALALVALSGLEPEPAELAHSDPGQDAGHRRERQPAGESSSARLRKGR
jgi:hypothetical protein